MHIQGESIRFSCRDLGEQGEGIGSLSDGMTCFVKNILPGESASVKISRVKKKYAIGKLLQIENNSPDRTSPQCNLFPKCGGCQIQHLSYEAQLKLKFDKTVNSLTRIGEISSPNVLPPIASSPWHYRNRLVLPVQGNSKMPRVGFFKDGTHEVVPLKSCPVGIEGDEPIIKLFLEALSEFKVPIYQEATHKGLVRHLAIRHSRYENKFVCTIIVTKFDASQLKPLANLLGSLENVKGVAINVNPDKGNRILGDKTIPLYGDIVLEEKINNVLAKISPVSFLQLNTPQAEIIYSKVLDHLKALKSKRVLEFYSGIGILSALIGAQCEKVATVEFTADSVQNAKENAQINEISNINFFQGDATESFDGMLSDLKNPDTAVLNPPRTGIENTLLNKLIASNIPAIIYISCKPSTLARDVQILCKNGYILRSAQPIDMFPQTVHIENVVLLTK